MVVYYSILRFADRIGRLTRYKDKRVLVSCFVITDIRHEEFENEGQLECALIEKNTRTCYTAPMDTVDTRQRSLNMSRIRSKDKRPELIVHSLSLSLLLKQPTTQRYPLYFHELLKYLPTFIPDESACLL